MSFFRRENSAPAGNVAARTGGAPSPGAERGRGATTLGSGNRIEGKLVGSGDVVVEGELRGEMKLEGHLVVAPGGKVHGDIEARTVSILGAVEGNVRGCERVELAASGSLSGDVSAPKVVISEGAFFKGKVEMQGAEGVPGAGPSSS